MQLTRENETPMASVAYLSDGIINLALIEYKSDAAAGKATSAKDEGKEFGGLHHLGFWVDDIEQAKVALGKNDGQYMMGEVPQDTGGSSDFYEIKYRDPDNIIVDITHSGWAGAVKEP